MLMKKGRLERIWKKQVDEEREARKDMEEAGWGRKGGKIGYGRSMLRKKWRLEMIWEKQVDEEREARKDMEEAGWGRKGG